jgi:poly(hydroxyalkanoate) depolymerase family esterase
LNKEIQMMNAKMNTVMLEATRLTRAGQLLEATEIIQRTLYGVHGSQVATHSTSSAAETPIEGDFHVIDAKPVATQTSAREPECRLPPRLRRASHERTVIPRVGIASLHEQWRGFSGPMPLPDAIPKQAPDPLPDGARFVTGSYTNPAGTRSYKLYVPSGYHGQPLPLVVMLHGCTQNPDDFAAGTRMNELAEEQSCFVLYPAQAKGANIQNCWNWFKNADQQRDSGESSLIAGMTREIIATYKVDERRVYVAGFSAGGAMAAVMGVTYPDLYAAVGVHSGLAYGAAHDLPSAFAAMQGNGAAPARPLSGVAPDFGQRAVPIIVFHGDRDTTVNARNADQIIVQGTTGYHSAAGEKPRVTVHPGQIPGGHAYTRTIYRDAAGQPFQEQWQIHGASHAWSGGSVAGSYTDPKGPDAAKEVLRFFTAHPLPEAASRH